MLAMAIIGGSYMLLVVIFSLAFGTIVDNNKKKNVMVFSSVITLIAYALAGLMYDAFKRDDLVDWNSAIFWLFSGTILVGCVCEGVTTKPRGLRRWFDMYLLTLRYIFVHN